ncbi:MAG: DNA polymerase III subunit delta [Clostridia bacterium]|nr:DNA polymerase III subunit delta [Clostridia bacterium]
MKFQDLKKNLVNNLPNLFFIKGEDAFLRDKAVEMIKNRAVTLKELNVICFDDESTDMVSIINSCRSLPMMDEHKVVILKNLAIKKAEELAPLVQYASSPVDTTILVVVANENIALYKKYEEKAVVVDCSYLDGVMLSKLIVTELSKRKVQINQDALNAVIEYCNYDYTRISNEVIKLSNFVGDGQIINLETVKQNVTKDVEYDIFEFTNAVSGRDGKTAISIVKNLLMHKEPPIKLMVLIHNSFRRMFFALSTTADNETVASQLGTKPYAVKIAREQGAKFGIAKLKKFMDLGAKLDFDIKNGKMAEENALIFFVTSICA